MKRVVAITVFTLLFTAVVGVASGDSGIINPYAKISEPGQSAVIG